MCVTNGAYFRIFTSLIGINTANTHLALRAEADADSEILKLTSEQFADLLAGRCSAPARRGSRLGSSARSTLPWRSPRHHLPPRGLARAQDQPDELRAVHRVQARVNPLLRDLRGGCV